MEKVSEQHSNIRVPFLYIHSLRVTSPAVWANEEPCVAFGRLGHLPFKGFDYP